VSEKPDGRLKMLALTLLKEPLKPFSEPQNLFMGPLKTLYCAFKALF
jgi:hypothetical protein